MSSIDTQKLITAIENTGYDLEHYVYEILKSKGWQVISNRYYIDDAKNVEREIDLLAYKTCVDDNQIIYYTVLLISCKKAKESLWAFLTRRKPENDPNTEYFFVDNYTTDKRLSFMLNTNQEEIKSEICAFPSIGSLFKIEHVPFAFQQINANSYKTEDDKRIYDSIITTIKALEYEKENRGRPKIESVKSYFYNFNLLSIFDGKMYDVYFSDADKNVTEIPEIKYLNRHIIGKKESFYKVHFITKDELDAQLDIYGELHNWNKNKYPMLVNGYYENIFTSRKKVDIYWGDFCKAINWRFNYSLTYELGYKTDDRTDEFSFDYENGILKIHFNGYYNVDTPDFLDRVNKHSPLMNEVKKELIKIFRYDGEFMFDDDCLPF